MWANRLIEIVTEEIRMGQRQGEARIVWQKINELKHKKTNMGKGNMVLKGKDGKPQSEPQVNLQIMKGT